MNLLESMRVFMEVAERGSFAKAAHAMHVSPAKVSTQVQKLETHAGVRLLNRSTRRVTLTDDGQQYFALCERVLGDIAETETSLGRSPHQPGGRLRIDASSMFVSRLILPILPEFQQAYLEIALEIVQTEHLFDVVQSNADVMIRVGLTPFKDTSLVARALGHSQIVFAASPDYLERHGEPRRPEDLLRHRCINFIDPLSGRNWGWLFERQGKRIEMEVPSTLAFSQDELRIEAAVMGLGILNDVQHNIRDLLSQGRLKRVLTRWSWRAPQAYVLYRKSRFASRKTQALVEFLQKRYPSGKPLS